jgi:preprotein translocase subunit SecY
LDGKSHLNVFGHSLPINGRGLLYGLIILLSVVIVTWIVVKLNEAARNLTVNYAKRVQGNRAYGGVTTTLPVKLITAGVVPIIFAIAFLSVPSFAGQLMSTSGSERLQTLGAHLVTWFQNPTAQTFATPGFTPYIYPIVYFLLVFTFTFFYTSITFNAKEIAENLHKQGGFIEGVRSGAQTEKYLAKTVGRLTLFGALSLGLLALLPIVGEIFLSSNIAIGGTSILILVSVALQTLRAIESRALMVTYDQYSRDDFFSDGDGSADTKKKRFRLLPSRAKS